jgi:hypothetical protein
MGFARALVPASTPQVAGIQLLRAATITEALAAVGLAGGRPGRGEW